MKKQALNVSIKMTSAILMVSFFVLTGFYNVISTGEIKGKVTDETTGERLSFVAIKLKDNDNKVISEVSSGLAGDYHFSNVLPGIYQCDVTLVGYQKKTFKNLYVIGGKTKVLNIQLNKVIELKAAKISIQNAPLINNRDETNQQSYSEEKAIKRNDINGYPTPSTGYEVTIEQEDFNREGYEYIAENEFHPALETPLSTFSIDVDKASYANMRRFINQGQLPPASAVRIEELINYFSYNYPQPKGDHPFSINTEVMICPWNKKHHLALIGLQGKFIEADRMPPANLVFLIDVSGSMSDQNKLPLLKKSLWLLVNKLRENDRVAIVVYAGNAGLVLPSTSGENKETIMHAIHNLEAGGSTAGGAGIQLAYKVAMDYFISNGNNRVILATDGDFNVGVSSDGELVRIIEEKRKSGVFLTVLGFGTGNYQDAKMEKLADKGNGNYSYIDNIMEAQKTFVNEMGSTLLTIAKDVKIQIEFNPALIKEYKLIGYENRLLQNRDFNDDIKDAGELGSGHTVTALYEIIPVSGTSSGVKIDPIKYQLKNLNNDTEFRHQLFTVKFRYKNPDADISKLLVHVVKKDIRSYAAAAENIRFASSVAAFGMLLRNSKFKGTTDYKMVLQMANEAKGRDVNGYRSEFIRIVETAQTLSKTIAGE